MESLKLAERCPFCFWEKDETLPQRKFYDVGNWMAFLAAPPHIEGHTLLIAKRENNCPQDLGCLPQGLSEAIREVVMCLKAVYECKDVLVVSLRSDIPHLHIHLIPLYADKEKEWRRRTGYETGRLMTYLGDLEEESVARDKREPKDRQQWTNEFAEKMKRLREFTAGEIAQRFCRDAALTQYTELSQDWRLHANDIWKYLLAIFVVHAGVFQLDLQLLRENNVFWLLLFFTIAMALAATKSSVLARRTRSTIERIGKHDHINMPFPRPRIEGVLGKTIFRPKSTFLMMLGSVIILIYFDYIFLLDP